MQEMLPSGQSADVLPFSFCFFSSYLYQMFLYVWYSKWINHSRIWTLKSKQIIMNTQTHTYIHVNTLLTYWLPGFFPGCFMLLILPRFPSFDLSLWLSQTCSLPSFPATSVYVRDNKQMNEIYCSGHAASPSLNTSTAQTILRIKYYNS